MKRVLWLAAAALSFALVSAVPLPAQSAQVSPPRVKPHAGVGGQVFVPGFGFRPIIQERDVVTGFGFDAHHSHMLRRGRRGFRRGFRGGLHFGFSSGFHKGTRFGFGFSSVPFFPFFGSGTSVVVVQQPVPVQIPVAVPVEPVRVVTLDESDLDDIPVVAGLPSDWGRVRIARSSYPRPTPRPPHLTLLVLKEETIIPARDYWLEDGRIFYVTSTGRQDSFPLRALDWEMTTELNAQRSVDFVLRSP